jgi:hypothetical protein
MFGMESQKNKKDGDFIFELEKEFKNGKLHNDLRDKIDTRIQVIKEVLRSGENKDEFDSYGVLLHGYTALLKVMSRFSPK